MKIKCKVRSERCSSCPFRNDTEFGTICNLGIQYWGKTIEVKMVKDVDEYRVKTYDVYLTARDINYIDTTLTRMQRSNDERRKILILKEYRIAIDHIGKRRCPSKAKKA